jgi:hypothetical protein
MKDVLFSDPELGNIEKPKVFLEWFNKNKIIINTTLQKTAIDLGIIEAKHFEWIKNLTVLDCFPNFPQSLDTLAEVIQVSLLAFINEHKRCPSALEAWSHMRRFPPNQYEIVSKKN